MVVASHPMTNTTEVTTGEMTMITTAVVVVEEMAEELEVWLEVITHLLKITTIETTTTITKVAITTSQTKEAVITQTVRVLSKTT